MYHYVNLRNKSVGDVGILDFKPIDKICTSSLVSVHIVASNITANWSTVSLFK